jgi:hypothetical protein
LLFHGNEFRYVGGQALGINHRLALFGQQFRHVFRRHLGQLRRRHAVAGTEPVKDKIAGVDAIAVVGGRFFNRIDANGVQRLRQRQPCGVGGADSGFGKGAEKGYPAEGPVAGSTSCTSTTGGFFFTR